MSVTSAGPDEHSRVFGAYTKDIPMTLKTLFVINAIVALMFGLGFLLAPAPLMAFYGATLNAPGVLMARFVGAEVLGHTILTWIARDSTASVARRAIVLALFTSWRALLIVGVLGQVTGVMNVLGWSNVILFLLFTVAYGYFAFVKSDAHPE
jgi:hypothetical protein